ncbi:RNA polymerase sigma factor [Streptomyces sp. NPDC057238]|uniref:RNA polymerase sigma factor n=1 Tax=Streptomyces sp. NPDC057238 TaxID=3346060 RepID=UPI003629E7FD
MRSNSMEGAETQSRTSTGSTGSPTDGLPEDIRRDVDRVTELVVTGFTGRLWQQTASDEERSTPHRNSADREGLDVRMIYVALETFPTVLKRGGYAPSTNHGKNGRPAKLTSSFHQRCGLVLPRVFYTWRDEREDRFERHARRMPGETLARVLGLDGSEPAAAGVAQLCDTLTGMITELKPRDRAVRLMTLDGLSRSEMADELGIKIGNVENACYAFRAKVKNLREAGALHVPPGDRHGVSPERGGQEKREWGGSMSTPVQPPAKTSGAHRAAVGAISGGAVVGAPWEAVVGTVVATPVVSLLLGLAQIVMPEEADHEQDLLHTWLCHREQQVPGEGSSARAEEQQDGVPSVTRPQVRWRRPRRVP